jgi:hypothetical protein
MFSRLARRPLTIPEGGVPPISEAWPGFTNVPLITLGIGEELFTGVDGETLRASAALPSAGLQFSSVSGATDTLARAMGSTAVTQSAVQRQRRRNQDQSVRGRE